MALSKTTPSIYGVDFQNAYHRVEEIQILAKTLAKFVVRSYAKNDGVPFFQERKYECNYDIDGNNPIAQAYAFLKTQSEFDGATDC